jgi:acetyl-CoA carboxylase biotin carboxyl carrier protein
MVGTFYRSLAVTAPPLVEAGRRVKKEDVVCIIEAMKVMNEVTADVEGEIVEVLVKDGQPVEFGQPLFRVKF